MGKLHTLRKQIKQNPEKWHDNGIAKCATREKNGEWIPYTYSRWSFGENPKSYASFVCSVLNELGTSKGR